MCICRVGILLGTVQINAWPFIIFPANITIGLNHFYFRRQNWLLANSARCPPIQRFHWTRSPELAILHQRNWATKTRFAGPKLDALSVLSTGIGISNPCAASFDRLRRSAPCLSLRFHGLQGASQTPSGKSSLVPKQGLNKLLSNLHVRPRCRGDCWD